MQNRNRSLFTAAEVKEVRDKMQDLQEGIDPVLGEPFKERLTLDHCHTSQHVRGVLGLNSNAFEGKINNAFTRCLSWLTDKPLHEILRNLANYLEQDFSANPYHPKWRSKIQTEFNKLNASQMKAVLELHNLEDAKNAAGRKAKFKVLTLDRSLGYDALKESLLKVKENHE